jgi:4,5-DOPA dioxygenase extradiol
LKHLYPKADVPVLQLSLYMEQPSAYHEKMGQQLMSLRDQGVLILGSGNLVHNLRMIRWQEDAPAFDWAVEFDDWLKTQITNRNFAELMHNFHSTKAGQLSIPTLEHYLPLHYVLSAVTKDDALRFEYEEIQNGSISMRSFSFGA